MTEAPHGTSERRPFWALVWPVTAFALAACGVAFWLVLWYLPRAESVGGAMAAVTVAMALAGTATGFVIGLIVGRSARAPAGPPAAPAEIKPEPTTDQQLLGHIINSMEGGVMTISSEGTITSFNAVAEKTLGYGAREVVGRHFSVVFGDIPENRPLRHMIAAALSEHRTFSSVEVNAAASDASAVALGVTVSLLRGEGGKHRGIVLTFKNLAELKQLREQVQRTDQLASLGRLAAGMAHEIRNPLGSLHGLVELIQEDLAEDDPKRRYTGTILRTMGRLNTLVEDLLEFSHPPITHVEPHDIRALAHEAVQLCAIEHRNGSVALREDYGPEPIRVAADREALTRAIINIVRNAFQAAPKGGTVTVSVKTRPPKEPGEPEHVIVAIANTGSYVKPEDRSKLFTPFFTTTPQGTGLGLPIAHQIISAHSGRIELESELDSGTTFNIILPVGAAGAEAVIAQDARDATV